MSSSVTPSSVVSSYFLFLYSPLTLIFLHFFLLSHTSWVHSLLFSSLSSPSPSPRSYFSFSFPLLSTNPHFSSPFSSISYFLGPLSTLSFAFHSSNLVRGKEREQYLYCTSIEGTSKGIMVSPSPIFYVVLTIITILFSVTCFPTPLICSTHLLFLGLVALTSSFLISQLWVVDEEKEREEEGKGEEDEGQCG